MDTEEEVVKLLRKISKQLEGLPGEIATKIDEISQRRFAEQVPPEFQEIFKDLMGSLMKITMQMTQFTQRTIPKTLEIAEKQVDDAYRPIKVKQLEKEIKDIKENG